MDSPIKVLRAKIIPQRSFAKILILPVLSALIIPPLPAQDDQNSSTIAVGQRNSSSAKFKPAICIIANRLIRPNVSLFIEI